MTFRAGYHLQASPIRVSTPPPAPPRPALISRQNVSLAAVLERRALNFKFSYTFSLNGTWRQRRRGRERGESRKRSMGDGLSRRLRPWTQREGEQRGERERSAEAAIISRHHYLYGLEIYANAISAKNSRTNGFTGSKKGACSHFAMAPTEHMSGTCQCLVLNLLKLHYKVT